MEIFGKLGIDGGKLVFQIINFLIVLYFLNRWIYKPLLIILENRRKEMADIVAAAEKSREESEKASERLEEELAEARAKAHGIVARAEEQAGATRQNAQAEAATQAEEIVTSAKKAMDSEKKSLMASVQKEIASLVVATSSKVLSKEVSGKHDEFIETEIRK